MIALLCTFFNSFIVLCERPKLLQLYRNDFKFVIRKIQVQSDASVHLSTVEDIVLMSIVAAWLGLRHRLHTAQCHKPNTRNHEIKF